MPFVMAENKLAVSNAALLVETQNTTATLENSWAFSS